MLFAAVVIGTLKVKYITQEYNLTFTRFVVLQDNLKAV